MMNAAASLDLDCVAIEGFIHSALIEILEENNIIDTNEYEPSVMLGIGYRNEEITPKKEKRFQRSGGIC